MKLSKVKNINIKTLDAIIREKYPQLSSLLFLESKDTWVLRFRNKKYSLWFIDIDQSSYIVGVDFLHQHFELNLNEVITYISLILNDEIVAVGYKDKETDFLIDLLSSKNAVKKYNNSEFEIVSFNGLFENNI